MDAGCRTAQAVFMGVRPGRWGVRPIPQHVFRTTRPHQRVRLLAKRRRWYAEDDDTGDRDDDGDNNQQDRQYNPADLDEANKIIRALVKRVDERDATIQTQQGQIDELKQRMDNIDSDRKKKLADEGKFQDLLKEREQELESFRPYKDEAEALRQVIQAGNEKLIAQIPEDRRSIVPDLTPVKLREWLDTNLSLLTRQAAPDFDAGAGAGSGKGNGSAPVQLTDAEKQMARSANMSDEQYAEYKAKRGQAVELKKGQNE